MSLASSLAAPVGLIGLATLIVAGLGSPLHYLCFGYRRVTLASAGLLMAMGLTTGLLFGLVTPSLSLLYAIWIPAAAAGLWFGLPQVRRRTGFAMDRPGVAAAALVVAALAACILNDPLYDWDARSIWFFHAKIIFNAGRVLDSRLWLDPGIAFSHVDYPKLNAFWAASVMHYAPGWNEFLPKISLILIATPAVLFCFGFSHLWLVRLLLLAALLSHPGPLLWNGYMDGWLAVYAGLGALYAARFVARGDRTDRAVALGALAVCAGLKNEGMVLAGLVVVTTAAACLWTAAPRPRLAALSVTWTRREVFVLIWAGAPSLLWEAWKKAAGVQDELSASAHPAGMLWGRLTDGHSLPQIAQAVLVPMSAAPMPLLTTVTAVSLLLLRRTGHLRWVAFWPTWGTALLFTGVLVSVYLATPHDLTWHLGTSADRTILAIQSCFVAGCVGAVSGMVATSGRSGESRRSP